MDWNRSTTATDEKKKFRKSSVFCANSTFFFVPQPTGVRDKIGVRWTSLIRMMAMVGGGVGRCRCRTYDQMLPIYNMLVPNRTHHWATERETLERILVIFVFFSLCSFRFCFSLLHFIWTSRFDGFILGLTLKFIRTIHRTNGHWCIHHALLSLTYCMNVNVEKQTWYVVIETNNDSTHWWSDKWQLLLTVGNSVEVTGPIVRYICV